MYNYGQQNNNSILNPGGQNQTGTFSSGIGSYFGGIWNGIKGVGKAIVNQATGNSAPQSPSSYNGGFNTPQIGYNSASGGASMVPTPQHFAPNHSVTTKTGPDGSSTITTTPVTTASTLQTTNPTSAFSDTANTYGSPINDTQGNAGVAQYDPMTGQPLNQGGMSGDSNAPGFGFTPFLVDTSGEKGSYPSTSLSGSTSYGDIMNQRDQLEQQYQQQYQTYLQSQANYQNLVNTDKQNATMAGFSGDTTGYGQGAQGLAQRTNAMTETAASSALNNAGVPLQATQNELGYANTNLSNFYNAAGLQLQQSPQFSGQTVNQSTGDIYGFLRDPVTGAVTTQVMGNVYNGNYGNTSGGSGYNSTGGQSQVSPLVQPYITQSIGGQSYVDSDRIPANQADAIKIQAAQAGIPVLTTDEVAKVRAIDQTSQNLTNIGNTIQSILKPGILGRGLDALENPIKDFLQTDTNISSFDSYRTAAINAIQALAGGSGSGFRLNQSEIDTATANLPTITDNLETANAKLAKMQTYLSQWTGQLFPNQTGTGSTSGSGGSQWSF